MKRRKAKAGVKRKKMRNTPDRNNGREENQEPEHIDIPKPAEPIQCYKDNRERKRDRTQDLRKAGRIHH